MKLRCIWQGRLAKICREYPEVADQTHLHESIVNFVAESIVWIACAWSSFLIYYHQNYLRV